jgi:hypothetical protein
MTPDSFTGHSCDDFLTNEWCTLEGKYGLKWSSNWNSFNEWLDPGTLNPAWACPQCGCNEKSELYKHILSHFRMGVRRKLNIF